jgi:hypothetical protein
LVDYSTLSIVFTGLSISIAAFYYIMTLRNTQRNQQLQLETRQAQMFMGIYNQLNQADFINAWMAFMEMEWSNYEELKLIQDDSELGRYLWVIGMFYEGLGVLVKNNLVPIKLVAETITGMTRMYWEKFIPIVEEGRIELNLPRWYSETEYLYNELMKYLEEHPELKT